VCESPNAAQRHLLFEKLANLASPTRCRSDFLRGYTCRVAGIVVVQNVGFESIWSKSSRLNGSAGAGTCDAVALEALGSAVVDEMHSAEHGLSAFIAAVTELLDPEQAQISAVDWLDELELMASPP
jgi:hypothetical protein